MKFAFTWVGFDAVLVFPILSLSLFWSIPGMTGILLTGTYKSLLNFKHVQPDMQTVALYPWNIQHFYNV